MLEKSPKKYIKEFDVWAIQKKILDERKLPDTFFFLEREIWWTAIGVNVGNEIDGKNENFERPVLILKKLDSNNFIGIPISTKNNLREIKHTTSYHKGERYILLKQIRHFSAKRLLKFAVQMDEEEFLIVKDKVINVLR